MKWLWHNASRMLTSALGALLLMPAAVIIPVQAEQVYSTMQMIALEQEQPAPFRCSVSPGRHAYTPEQERMAAYHAQLRYEDAQDAARCQQDWQYHQQLQWCKAQTWQSLVRWDQGSFEERVKARLTPFFMAFNGSIGHWHRQALEELCRERCFNEDGALINLSQGSHVIYAVHAFGNVIGEDAALNALRAMGTTAAYERYQELLSSNPIDFVSSMLSAASHGIRTTFTSAHTTAEKIANNADNRALLEYLRLCEAWKFAEADRLIWTDHTGIGAHVRRHTYAAYRRATFDEHGIKRAYAQDPYWRDMTPDEKRCLIATASAVRQAQQYLQERQERYDACCKRHHLSAPSGEVAEIVWQLADDRAAVTDEVAHIYAAAAAHADVRAAFFDERGVLKTFSRHQLLDGRRIDQLPPRVARHLNELLQLHGTTTDVALQSAYVHAIDDLVHAADVMQQLDSTPGLVASVLEYTAATVDRVVAWGANEPLAERTLQVPVPSLVQKGWNVLRTAQGAPALEGTERMPVTVAARGICGQMVQEWRTSHRLMSESCDDQQHLYGSIDRLSARIDAAAQMEIDDGISTQVYEVPDAVSIMLHGCMDGLPLLKQYAGKLLQHVMQRESLDLLAFASTVYRTDRWTDTHRALVQSVTAARLCQRVEYYRRGFALLDVAWGVADWLEKGATSFFASADRLAQLVCHPLETLGAVTQVALTVARAGAEFLLIDYAKELIPGGDMLMASAERAWHERYLAPVRNLVRDEVNFIANAPPIDVGGHAMDIMWDTLLMKGALGLLSSIARSCVTPVVPLLEGQAQVPVPFGSGRVVTGTALPEYIPFETPGMHCVATWHKQDLCRFLQRAAAVSGASDLGALKTWTINLLESLAPEGQVGHRIVQAGTAAQRMSAAESQVYLARAYERLEQIALKMPQPSCLQVPILAALLRHAQEAVPIVAPVALPSSWTGRCWRWITDALDAARDAMLSDVGAGATPPAHSKRLFLSQQAKHAREKEPLWQEIDKAASDIHAPAVAAVSEEEAARVPVLAAVGVGPGAAYVLDNDPTMNVASQGVDGGEAANAAKAVAREPVATSVAPVQDMSLSGPGEHRVIVPSIIIPTGAMTEQVVTQGRHLSSTIGAAAREEIWRERELLHTERKIETINRLAEEIKVKGRRGARVQTMDPVLQRELPQPDRGLLAQMESVLMHYPSRLLATDSGLVMHCIAGKHRVEERCACLREFIIEHELFGGYLPSEGFYNHLVAPSFIQRNGSDSQHLTGLHYVQGRPGNTIVLEDREIGVSNIQALDFGCYAVQLIYDGQEKESTLFRGSDAVIKIILDASYAFDDRSLDMFGDVKQGFFMVTGRAVDGMPITIVIKHGEIYTIYPSKIDITVQEV